MVGLLVVSSAGEALVLSEAGSRGPPRVADVKPPSIHSISPQHPGVWDVAADTIEVMAGVNETVAQIIADAVWDAHDEVEAQYNLAKRYWPTGTLVRPIRVQVNNNQVVQVGGSNNEVFSYSPDAMIAFRNEPQTEAVDAPPPPSDPPIENVIEQVVGPRPGEIGKAPQEPEQDPPPESSSVHEDPLPTPGNKLLVHAGPTMASGSAWHANPPEAPVGPTPRPTTEDESGKGSVASTLEALPEASTRVVNILWLALLGAGAAWYGLRRLPVRVERLRAFLPGVTLWGLFSRQSGRAVLRHPLRAAIHGAVAHSPGITVCDLAVRLQLNRSTLRYHLRVLERETHVKVVREGKTVHVFSLEVGLWDRADIEAWICLLRPHRSALAHLVLDAPGRSQQDLARAVRLPASNVHTYLAALRQTGLVAAVREGRYQRYFPTERLLDLAQRLPGHGQS